MDKQKASEPSPFCGLEDNGAKIEPPKRNVVSPQTEPTHTSKGPSKAMRGAEEECLVCGDHASGYHYNALWFKLY